jgi:hypothetical protein
LRALIECLKILVSDNIRSRLFENHEEVVVLSTVSIARDIPLHTEGPRGCLAGDFVVDTLGSVLIDVQIAPEGEKRVSRETDVSSRERLVSV